MVANREAPHIDRHSQLLAHVPFLSCKLGDLNAFRSSAGQIREAALGTTTTRFYLEKAHLHSVLWSHLVFKDEGLRRPST